MPSGGILRARRDADHPMIVYSSQYEVRRERLGRLHPSRRPKARRTLARLLDDGLLRPEDVRAPQPVSATQLRRVHTADYLESLRSPGTLARLLESRALRECDAETVESGFLQPFRHVTGGTLAAARLALRHGLAFNLGGGYHHAGPDFGGGFCVYADVPLAVRLLQDAGEISRVLVIDLDGHQGNGVIACLEGDARCRVFSMHQAGVYPFGEDREFWDVALEAGAGDERYLGALAERLPEVFARAAPDLVFYLAGGDVLEIDRITELALTFEGALARDALVYQACRERGLPVATLPAGGYSDDVWRLRAESARRALARHLPSPDARTISGP